MTRPWALYISQEQMKEVTRLKSLETNNDAGW